MDKNKDLYIVLGFLLLCILLSLDEKEGFVVIYKSAFEEQCSADHECIVTQSGNTGFICSENPHSDNYNINGGGDGVTIFNDPFPLSLDTAEPCNSDNADPDPSVVIPSISACTTSDSPYELSGCISKCNKPLSSDIYDLSSAPLKVENSTDPIPTTDITCKDGFVPAANICFDKGTGAINPNRNMGDCVGQNDIWYDDAQGVKTYCPSPGADYVIMGCEPSCLSRISHSDDYIMDGATLEAGGVESNYRRGKELMQVTPQRSESSIGPVRVINNPPYNVNEDGSSLDPNNFSVTITPARSAIPGGGVIDFEGVGVSEACNINSDNEDTRDKYFVKGLFPTCGDDEECLNFNISYNDDETKPHTLEELKEQLPIDIFQGNPTPDDIQKYKDSLYYFRGFMGSDGKYNVEGQIRCNIDSSSRYGCAIITNEETDPITWILGERDQSCNEVCDGINSTCTVPDIDSESELQTKMGEFGHADCTPERATQGHALGPYLHTATNVCRFPDVSYENLQQVYDCETHNATLQRLCKCQG